MSNYIPPHETVCKQGRTRLFVCKTSQTRLSPRRRPCRASRAWRAWWRRLCCKTCSKWHSKLPLFCKSFYKRWNTPIKQRLAYDHLRGWFFCTNPWICSAWAFCENKCSWLLSRAQKVQSKSSFSVLVCPVGLCTCFESSRSLCECRWLLSSTAWIDWFFWGMWIIKTCSGSLWYCALMLYGT